MCEVIVVDNASTDSTSATMLEYDSQGIRLLFEPTPGLSGARNRGVDASRAPWVLFLDDDVEMGADFLRNYIQHISEKVDAGFFGGPVIPRFDGPPRVWTNDVNRDHWWIYSCLNFGGPTRPFSSSQSPFGANFCVKRDLLTRFRFSPDKGYRHGELTPGEETAVIDGVKNAGFAGWWLADCPVIHCLPAERNSPRYLIRRAFGEGLSSGRTQRSRGDSALWALKQFVVDLPKLAWRLVLSPSRAMSTIIGLAVALGVLRGRYTTN